MNLENYLFRYIMFYHIQKIYPTIHQSIQLYVQQARVDTVTDRCTRCFPNYLPCHMSLWTVDISSITSRGPVLTRSSSTEIQIRLFVPTVKTSMYEQYRHGVDGKITQIKLGFLSCRVTLHRSEDVKLQRSYTKNKTKESMACMRRYCVHFDILYNSNQRLF